MVFGAKRTTVLRCLYQARKAITWKWINSKPPSVIDWLGMVNNTINREKLAYLKNGGGG